MTTGFERDPDEFARGARALVVYPDMGASSRDSDARLEEPAGLAMAIGVEVREKVAVKLRQPKPGTLIGSGQVEALAETVRDEDLQLAVFDAALTPVQQRNLETALGCKVIDRTGLILEIFGERARTAEGRLQVELAHLDYQAGRLGRSWTPLERPRGRFGLPGRPRRNPDRSRQAPDPRPHGAAAQGARPGQPHADATPRPQAARALAG